MLVYFLNTVLLTAITYVLYLLFFKKEKNFKFIRFYLLVTLILSLLAPLMTIQVQASLPSIEDMFTSNTNESLTTFIEKNTDAQHIQFITKPSIELLDVVLLIYGLITLVFLFRYFRNITIILNRIKESTLLPNGMSAIFGKDSDGIYSFFNLLYISKNELDQNGIDSPKLLHEMAHYKQLHSLDILFIQFLLCFFWFNPFMWLYKKVICENHEYLADQYVLNIGVPASQYAAIILQSTQRQSQQFYSGFNFNQTKTRLLMLQKSNSSPFKMLTKLIIVTFICLTVFSFSAFNYKKPLVVVIDAGHGGEDPGNTSNQVPEKDINLAVALKLQALSDDKVKFILVRNEDSFLTLDKRIKFANSQNADLYIGIHCDAAKKSETRGVTAFINENDQFAKRSKRYASLIVESLLSDESDKGSIKTSNFFVLKNSNIPALVLEMGFLTNKTDYAKLSNSKNHELIAKNMYQALIEIGR